MVVVCSLHRYRTQGLSTGQHILLAAESHDKTAAHLKNYQSPAFDGTTTASSCTIVIYMASALLHRPRPPRWQCYWERTIGTQIQITPSEAKFVLYHNRNTPLQSSESFPCIERMWRAKHRCSHSRRIPARQAPTPPRTNIDRQAQTCNTFPSWRHRKFATSVASK